MDIIKIYSQYGVLTAHQGQKHHRAGWVQTPCPFCVGSAGYHLGYNIADDYFNCWRCGYKDSRRALSKVLGISITEAKKVIKQAKGISVLDRVKAVTVKRKKFKMPPKLMHITKTKFQMKYMIGRGFTRKDLFLLQKRFKIQCTGPISTIGNMGLKWRIVAPIPWEGDTVSWQTRDCTGNNDLKYITCPKERETIHHKHILYHPPQNNEILILTEGIFDVWKIFLSGFDVSTCGFGVELKDEQVLLLKQYKRVLVWLDPDKAGKKKANELFNRLVFAGVNLDVIENKFGDDPGDLDKDEICEVLDMYI